MIIKRFRHINESSSIDGELQSIANIVLDNDDINAKLWSRNNTAQDISRGGAPDMVAAVIGDVDRIACLRMVAYRDSPTGALKPESMDIIRNVAQRMMQVVDITIQVNGLRYVTIEQLEEYHSPMSIDLFIMPRAGDFFYGDEQVGFANYDLNRIVLWTHKPFNTRNGPSARLDKGVMTKLSFNNQRVYQVGLEPRTGTMNPMYNDKRVVSIEYSEVDLSFKYKYIIELQ